MRILKRVLLGLLGVVVTGLLYDVATRPTWNPESHSAVPERSTRQVEAAFDGSTFASASYAKKKTTDILKWSLNRNQGPWVERPTQHATELVAREQDAVRVTLVNHSTLLIQTQGVNVLTDPIWSTATGPFGRFGPVRFRSPGIRFDDLPPIDAVFVSHSHYDHMDLPTLQKLHERDRPRFIVGLGNGDNLAKVGIDRSSVVEADWWQSVDLGNELRLTMTPAQHWSKRSILDTNRTLWGSFVLRHNERALVFFAGDTGYGAHFSAVRQTVGPVRVALMPIGAYLPRWFMKDNHMSPDEAVRAAMDLGSDVMIPMHFGTFALGDDGQDEPLADLLEAYRTLSDDAPELRALDNGQHTLIQQ